MADWIWILDAILGGNWGRSRDRCIRWGSMCLKGKGGSGVFSPIDLNCIFLKRNIFDLCVEVDSVFIQTLLLLKMFVYWLSEDIVSFKIELGVYEKFAKM